MIVAKEGPDFWPSTFAIRIESGYSYRTVQRHIDELERLNVLEKKYEANVVIRGFGFRRSATYVLHKHADRWLGPRLTYQEWKQTRPAAAPFHRATNRSHTRESGPAQQPPAQAKQLEAVPAPAAPVPVARESQHRSTAREVRKLTPREGRELVKTVVDLMRGNTHFAEVGGYGYELTPQDPRYRAPMTKENALISACMRLGIPHEAALDHLKLCNWQFDEQPSE